MYSKLKQSVFLVYCKYEDGLSQGTGFFIRYQNKVVGISNYHVFKGSLKGGEMLKTFSGETYKVKAVINKSEADDYIIFELYNLPDKYKPIPISTEKYKIGQDIFTIGNPEGLEHTLSNGIISADRGKLIQITAPITHGSSGGPLLDMSGKVLGITTSGVGAANLNFAVDINVINKNNTY